MIQPQNSETHSAYVPLVLALCIGCVLMLPSFADTPLAIDEHVSFWVADANSPGTLWQRSQSIASTPPLASILQRLTLLIGGRSVGVFRASSVLCYLAAIVVTWKVGQRILGNTAAGIAAVLLAVHPEVVEHAQVARPYGPTLLVSAMAVWATVRWQQTPHSWRWLFIWVLTGVALVWTHYVNAPLLTVLWIGLWGPSQRFLPNTVNRIHLLGAGVLVVLLVSPLVPAVLRIWEWRACLNYNVTAPSPGDVIGPLWWCGLPAGLLTVLFLNSIQRRWPESQTRRLELVRLALWGAAPLLVILLLSSGDLTSLAGSRYRIVYAPAGVLLISGCLVALASRPVAWIATVCLVLATGSCLKTLPGQSLQTSATAREWRTIAETINQKAKPNAPVFVQSGLVETFLVNLYYQDRMFMDYVSSRAGRFYLTEPHSRFALPALWIQTADLEDYYKDVVRNACADSKEVWLAGAIDTDLNKWSVESMDTLLTYFGLTRRVEFKSQNAVLYHYQCVPPETR